MAKAIASKKACAATAKKSKPYQSKERRQKEVGVTNILSEVKLISLFGIFAIVVGLLPYMLVRYEVYFGPGSRNAILANVGVSIFIASFLPRIIHKIGLNIHN